MVRHDLPFPACLAPQGRRGATRSFHLLDGVFGFPTNASQILPTVGELGRLNPFLLLQLVPGFCVLRTNRFSVDQNTIPWATLVDTSTQAA